MTRFTNTTAITLILSLSALHAARAANTTPYVYGLPNTTLSSSVKPTVVPNTVYSQPNTTINSSIKPFVVPNTVYSQPNTTINTNISPKLVTTATGLLANTAGTFAVPNVKATIATGPITIPKSGSYYTTFGDGASSDASPDANTISNATTFGQFIKATGPVLTFNDPPSQVSSAAALAAVQVPVNAPVPDVIIPPISGIFGMAGFGKGAAGTFTTGVGTAESFSSPAALAAFIKSIL